MNLNSRNALVKIKKGTQIVIKITLWHQNKDLLLNLSISNG